MDYVFATITATVLYAPTGAVELTEGQVWFADDPFVKERPDLFSATPPICHSTVDKPSPEQVPVGKPRRRRG